MLENGNPHGPIPSRGVRAEGDPDPAGGLLSKNAVAGNELAVSDEFWKLVVLEGSGLVVLGLLAVALPKIASLAVSLMTGWLLLIAGLFRFASIFSAHGGPGYWSSMLLAAMTAVLGAILVIFPVDGVLSLTIALAIYLCAHGLVSLSVASAMRGATRQWFWLALGSAADFLLAGLVIEGWPSSAPLILGLYVGINLVVAGVALILAATGAHRVKTSSAKQ